MSSSTLDNKSESNIKELDDDQAAQYFEELVRNYLGISADQFLERYNKGEFKGVCNDSRLLKVIMMIPKAAGARGKK